jgi:hypothetical protein
MINRTAIRAMYGGRCAYCGHILGERWHIDHAAPIYRGWKDKPNHAGGDPEDNLFPACPRCNLRKTALSIKDFRLEIFAQLDRLRRDSAPFRLAEDYGLIRATGAEVVFYFERQSKETGEGV